MDLEPLKIDRSRAAPRRRRAGGGGRLIVALVALGLVGAGWLFRAPALRALDKVRLPQVRAVRVERSHPAAAGAVSGLAANGYVVASRRAALSADTPGRIVELLVTEGTRVEEGDLVARLFDEEYAAALKRAEADLAQAQASLTRAEAACGAARAERGRARESAAAAAAVVSSARADLVLAEREQARALELSSRGINTQRELDQAEAALARGAAGVRQAVALERAARGAVESAAAQLEVTLAERRVARARVEVAAAVREQAAATLRKTEVRAPFKGVVVLKDAEVGEVVSPNVVGGSTARGSVATLVDFTSLEVQADLPETSLQGVEVGAPAQVFLDAYPSRPYRGKVSRIWPTANRQKATVEVRISFERLDERLRPEMGVRVVFAAAKEGASPAKDEGPAPLLVPSDALVKVDGREGVFVLERGVASFVAIGLGERRGGQVIVRAGLSGGERVVLSPPNELGDGDRVREEGS